MERRDGEKTATEEIENQKNKENKWYSEKKIFKKGKNIRSLWSGRESKPGFLFCG
jgi:hypothetical protein